MFDKQTRVLVADDSLVVRRSIKNMFKEIEFTNVDEAKDGQQAYDKILAATEANEDYGLIISDINMPNMDGLALVRELRGNDTYSKIPFVFVTARGQEKDIQEGLSLGADHYITKPFTKDDLLKSLGEVFEKVQSR